MSPSRRDVIKLGLSAIAESRLLPIGAVAGLTGCGGSGNNGSTGSGGSTTPVTTASAPSGLSYQISGPGKVGTAFGPLSPTVTGSVTSYSVSPAFPAGVTLNPTSGVISGTPTKAAAAATYTITASNAQGSTTFGALITVDGAIVITASTAAPTALTPVSLTVLGLDFTSPFTVQLANTSGYNGVLTPIRTDATAGLVVVAAPLYIDPTTGTTAPLSASVQITQSTLTSNALPLQVADLPSVASYGVNPGDISRGFYNAQSIYYGITVNALQAMRALPTSKTDTSTVQSHLMAQQISSIEARGSVDLIITGSQPSLSVGIATDGSAIKYDSNSVDIQDRIFGLYLQSIGYLPSTIYTEVPASAKRPYVHPQRRTSAGRKKVALASTISNVTYTGRALDHTKPPVDSNTPRVVPTPLKNRNYGGLATPRPNAATPTPASIINGLAYVGGAVGITNSAIQTNTAKNSTDAIVAIGQGVSTAALVIGTLAAAPELIALATIVGTGFAVAGLVNDSYKWYTASNAVAAATDSGDAQALATAEKDLSDAKANVAVDAVGSVLGVFGFPAEVAEDIGLGAQVVNAITTAQTGLSGVAVQGLSLLTSAIGLAVTVNGQEMTADAQTTQNSNLEIPPSSTSFGVIDGMTQVYDANGPGLSPLSGAYLTEPNTGTAFSTLGGTDDNYSLIVPLGVPGYDYGQMSLETYDPVSFVATGAPITIDLSSLTGTTPEQVPTITGTCTDTDAADPDEDDPDCD